MNRITDWENLAEASRYSTRELAKRCNVTSRQLERYFLGTKGMPPRQWLTELRQRRALELMAAHSSVKAAAWRLGYRQAAHFSREFKRYHGVCATEIG
ncbi:MAG: helix-turn-helix transcriptional regulator [Verrucomicrobiae bacterium]|nr:helix-turn-helix transcriptional regulator [Verrucomicrobiae bacterium]